MSQPSPERAVTDLFEAKRLALLRAAPPPIAVTSGAHVVPRGALWQHLEDAIAQARAGDWTALNAMERRMAPACPSGWDPRNPAWRIAREIKSPTGKLIGYAYVYADAGKCAACDGEGDFEAYAADGRTFDVTCPECVGSGKAEGDEVGEYVTDLFGDLVGPPPC